MAHTEKDKDKIRTARNIAADIVLLSDPLKGTEDGASIFIMALAIASGAFMGSLVKEGSLEEVVQKFAEDTAKVALLASNDEEPTIQ